MRELGSGYSFVGRQEKLFINNSIYRVDLVFYNKILKCFVLIELKIGKVKRGDIAQMNMYINYYNKYVIDEMDNKTIGIILTNDKNPYIVDYITTDANLYQVEYVTKMPSIEELEDIIKCNKILLLRSQ